MKFAEAPVPRDQINLIPTSLGDLIPQGHPIRLLDELLGQLDWSAFDEQFRYEKRGRPPISPQILAAVWIYAFFRRVRSSRQLEYQLNTNIEFMWLAHGHRIDHSTLAAFRKRNKSALKKIHSNLIQLAKDLGIIKIAELYVDGTRIAANASRSRMMTAEKATKLLDIIQKEIDEYLERTECADQADVLFDDGASGEQLPEHLNTLNKRKTQLQEIVQTCNEMDATRKKQGIDPKKNPFQLPLTDQDSRILPNKDGGYAPNYTPIVGVEGELGLIVSSTIINSVNEQDYLVETVDEVERTFDVTVETVGADAAFSTGPNISELEEVRGKDFVSPHRNGDVPQENPAIRDDPTQPVSEADLDKLPTDSSRGTFSTEAFVYDEEKDIYHCPQGRELTRAYQETRTQSGGQQVTRTIYQSPDCAGCPLLSRCRTGSGHKTGRRVSRDEHEKARAAHRQKMSTEAAKTRYNKRFSIGERPFGQIKRGFGMRRFQTRGHNSVSSEFSLAGLAHNLLRLTNHLGSLGNLRELIAANG